ncbi:unnamed protein product, partial [Ectocarpus fasciculatus]
PFLHNRRRKHQGISQIVHIPGSEHQTLQHIPLTTVHRSESAREAQKTFTHVRGIESINEKRKIHHHHPSSIIHHTPCASAT